MRCLLAQVTFWSVVGPPALKAACGDTEEDRLVWARERMHPGASASQTRLVYQWLTNGTGSCNLSGDLWYYRGLVARKMGNSSDAAYSFRKADENGSKAQRAKFDPFTVVTRPSGSTGKIRDKWALIIGINNLGKSDDFLQYAKSDAVALGDFLVHDAHFKNDKEHVKVLVDEKATTENIRLAFGEIRASAQPDDLVVVYLSSHGRGRELDPTGLSYVLTYDTDTTTKATTFASAIKMAELAELGRWVLSRQYVLLLDTCYSGGAQPESRGGDGLDPLQGLQGSGDRVVISASKAEERSFEDPETKHGYFTRYLLDALRQKGGQPTIASVFEFLQSRVPTEVSRQENRQQHPVMQAYGQGGSIVLSAQTPGTSARLPSAFLLANAR